jgi:hypothetical protein
MAGVGEARTRSWQPSRRRLALAVVVGLGVGFGAFFLTSMQPAFGYLGFCHPGVAQGFDPWTGQPHGSTLICDQNALVPNPQATINDPIPPALVGRQAIPVPLGFVVGAGVVLLIPVLRRRDGSGASEAAGVALPSTER